MNPHFENGQVRLFHGDCLDVLRTLPDASVDAVVTDPPYGLEFMGKDWDAPWKGEANGFRRAANPADVGRDSVFGRASARGPEYRAGVGFQSWCEAWAAECLRVLKPGGHLLAFGGTRTWHRLACAVEDAGFEVRDSIAWLYGSGFPKSLDVSKAIDKANGRQFEDRFALGRHIRERRESLGHTRAEVNGWLGASTKAEHYESDSPGFARVPTLADWNVLRDRLGLSDEHAALVERIEAEREVVGGGVSGKTYGMGGLRGIETSSGEFDITAPATPDAERWQGWGTALKPAHEPVVVARKPLTGTVAANVQAHGTGALNIDACRIGTSGATTKKGQRDGTTDSVSAYGHGLNGGGPTPIDAGRWPANVILDDDMAGVLDEQSGERPGMASQNVATTNPKFRGGVNLSGSMAQPTGRIEGYNDTGGASRFFFVAREDEPKWKTTDAPADTIDGRTSTQSDQSASSAPALDSIPRFLYQAKAPKRERPVVDGVAHPTVKPLTLMRWLVRLVTPPGGTVLEPFAGSGTTVEACIVEGFQCIAIEKGDEYLPLIRERIRRQTEPPEVEQLTRRTDPEAAIVEQLRDVPLFELDGEGA